MQGAKPVEPRRAGRVDMFGGVACVVEAMAAAGAANLIKMWGHSLLATLKRRGHCKTLASSSVQAFDFSPVFK